MDISDKESRASTHQQWMSKGWLSQSILSAFFACRLEQSVLPEGY